MNWAPTSLVVLLALLVVGLVLLTAVGIALLIRQLMVRAAERKLSKEEWVGWLELLASPFLLERLRRQPATLWQRLADFPSQTPAEALQIVGLLDALDPHARHAADAADADAEWTLTRQCLDGLNEDVAQQVLARCKHWPTARAAAMELVLALRGWADQGAVAAKCLLAWPDLTPEQRRAALCHVNEHLQGGWPLLVMALEACATDTTLEWEVLRLADRLASLAGAPLAEPQAYALSRLLQTHAGFDAVRRQVARWRVAHLLADDVAATGPFQGDLADDLQSAHTPLSEDEAAALAVLDARRPDPVDPARILDLHERRPRLQSPRRFLLAHSPFAPARRCSLIESLAAREGLSAEVAAAWATAGLQADIPVPWNVLARADVVGTLGADGLIDRWLTRACALQTASSDEIRELARRLAERAPEWLTKDPKRYLTASRAVLDSSRPDPAELIELAAILQGAFVDDLSSRAPAATLKEITRWWLETYVAHDSDAGLSWLPTAEVESACQEQGDWQGALAWARFSLVRGLPPECQLDAVKSAFAKGGRSYWLLDWLTTWMLDHLDDPRAEAVFAASAEAPGPVGERGAVGLIRLPRRSRPLDWRHLERAWRAGDTSDTLLLHFLEWAPGTRDEPFAHVEFLLAREAWRLRLPFTRDQERRLLLNFLAEKDPHPPWLDLLRQHADEIDLLTDFLIQHDHDENSPVVFEVLQMAARAGQATAAQHRQLIQAWRDKRFEPDFPLLHALACTPYLDAVQRLRIVQAAGARFPQQSAQLAALLPGLLETLRVVHPDVYREQVQDSAFVAQLCCFAQQHPDDAFARLAAAHALTTSRQADVFRVELLQAAFAARELEPAGVLLLAETLAESARPSEALPALRWLAEARKHLHETADLLARLARVEGAATLPWPWLESDLLLVLIDNGKRDPILLHTLADKLPSLASDATFASRTMMLARHDIPFPVEQWARALGLAETAQRRTLANLMVRLVPNPPTPPWCDLLQAVVADRLIDRPEDRWQMFAALWQARRLSLAETANWLLLACECNRTDLPEDLLAMQGQELAASTSWPTDLVGALRWFVQSGRFKSVPAELRARLALDVRADAPMPNLPLHQTDERMALPSLLGEIERCKDNPEALERLAGLLVDWFHRENKLAHGMALDRFCELDGRGLLPAKAQSFVLRSLISSGRVDLLARQPIERWRREDDPAWLRRALAQLQMRPLFHATARSLLEDAVRRFPHENWISPLLLAAERAAGAADFLRVLESQLYAFASSPEETRRGLTALLAGSNPVPRTLLQRAIDQQALPAGQPSEEELERHIHELESHVHESPLAQARAFRLALRALSSDPARLRRNDLFLIKLHRHAFSARDMTALLQPNDDLPLGMAHVNDPMIVEEALRLLPEGRAWDADEIALASLLIREAEQFDRVVQRHSPSLSALLDDLLPVVDEKQATEILAQVVQTLPEGEDFTRRFAQLTERLRDQATRLQAFTTTLLEKLLGDDRLPLSATRALLNLDAAADCKSAPLLRAAARVQQISLARAGVLIQRCLGDRDDESAFALLEQLVARCADPLEPMPSVALPIRIEDEPKIALTELLQSLEGYLSENRDARVMLRRVEILPRLLHFAGAARETFELWKHWSNAQERQPASAAWPAWLQERLRKQVAVLAENLRNSLDSFGDAPLEDKLACGVLQWLNAEINPAAATMPSREQIEQARTALALLEKPVGSNIGGNAEKLLECRTHVEAWAIAQLRRWVDGQPSAPWMDQLELTRLLAQHGHDREARKRIGPILLEHLAPGAKEGQAFPATAEAAILVLSVSIQSAGRSGQRNDRLGVLNMLDHIHIATNGFINLKLRSLSGPARLAYARLMMWSAVTASFHHLTSVERETSRHASNASFWFREILADDQTAGCGRAEFLGLLHTALEHANSKDRTAFTDVCRALESNAEFGLFLAWLVAEQAERVDEGAHLDQRYEKKERLSVDQGSRRAEAWLLRDLKSDNQAQLVVGKMLPSSSGALLQRQLERMRREAETLRKINHPGLVKVLDDHLDALPYYLILEYIPGVDLQKWLHQDPRPSRAERLAVFREILDIVRVMHAHGCLHRNLHTNNIRITQRGQWKSRVVLIDMASIVPQDTSREGRTQLVDRASAYMAPELRSNDRHAPVGAAADIFSLGRLLAFLLTLRADAPPEHFPLDLPALRDLYRKATERDPQRRHGNGQGDVSAIDELIEDFQTCVGAIPAFSERGARSVVAEASCTGFASLGQYLAQVAVFRKTAQGRILRGQSRDTGDPIAVKVVPLDSPLAHEIVPRLRNVPPLREKLNQIPGAVPIALIEPIQANGAVHLFSRFIAPGISLEDIFTYASLRGERGGGPVSPALLLRWLRSCLETLDLCHRAGIFHRCLKPSNILVDEQGRAWISDFILSRVYTEKLLKHTQLLRRGDSWTAPEAYGGQAWPGLRDLYSLVLTLAVGLPARYRTWSVPSLLPELQSVGRRRGLEPVTQLLCGQLSSSPQECSHRTVAAYLQALDEATAGAVHDNEDAGQLVHETNRFAARLNKSNLPQESKS